MLPAGEETHGRGEVARLLLEIDRLHVHDAPVFDREDHARELELAQEHGHIEGAHVVTREVRVAEELENPGGDLGKRGRPGHVGVRDAVDARGFARDLDSRVHAGLECGDRVPRAEPQSRDFHDPVRQTVGAGRLEVEDDERPLPGERSECREGLGGKGEFGHALDHGPGKDNAGGGGASQVQVVPRGIPGGSVQTRRAACRSGGGSPSARPGSYAGSPRSGVPRASR